MMSIDSDLFQLIVIALLAISLLVSLLNLSTLSRVKKQLNETSFAAPGTGTGSIAELGSGDSFASPYAAQEPAATQTAAFQPTSAQPVQAQQVYAQPAYTAEPVQAAPVQATPAQAAPMEATEPQEQPFERDGRWWFRRGAELLVYDEQTAQWVPAPGGAGGVTTATLTDGGAGADTGSFWKCPSCGAVNGSTATSCRMCFTARA